MKENSSGSVIPVKNEATAAPIKIEATILRFSGRAVWIKARRRRKSEHHNGEEARHEHACRRVSVEEAGQVAVHDFPAALV